MAQHSIEKIGGQDDAQNPAKKRAISRIATSADQVRPSDDVESSEDISSNDEECSESEHSDKEGVQRANSVKVGNLDWHENPALDSEILARQPVWRLTKPLLLS